MPTAPAKNGHAQPVTLSLCGSTFPTKSQHMKPHKFNKPTLSLASIGAALCLFASTCLAQSAEAEGNGLRISGFGTLGVVHSEAPAGWSFLRNVEQPSSSRSTRVDVDSRLGIQLNYAANSQIELVGQLQATRRLPAASAGDAVEWGFVAYRPTADLAFRAGRLNLDQFVMSDYRNVGFAYLYARPPVEYYGSVPSTLDGADFTSTWSFDDSRWRAKAFAGRSKTGGVALSDVYGISVSREADGLLLRGGWTTAKLTRNSSNIALLLGGLDQIQALPIPAVAAEAEALRGALDLSARPFTYITLGLTYDREHWQFAAELANVSIGRSNVKVGYASIARRFGAATWFAMMSDARDGTPPAATPAWEADLSPIIGPAAAQQAQVLGATAAYAASQSIRQTTYSLGSRWDVHPRMAVKVQWDHVRVHANGGYLWSNANSDPGTANIGTVLLDFVF